MTDTSDTSVMEHPSGTVADRIDQLVDAADELLRLSVNGRTMFSANEVLDFALDARVALLEARGFVIPAEITN